MNQQIITFVLIAQEGAPGPEGLLKVLPLLPWIAIGLFFYLLIIRPDRQKRKNLEASLNRLKKNDRVVTVGGIFGTVVQTSQDADDVTLKVDESSNTRIRVLRSSISRVLTQDGSESS